MLIAAEDQTTNSNHNKNPKQLFHEEEQDNQEKVK